MRRILYLIFISVVLSSCYKQTISKSKLTKDWKVEEISLTTYDTTGKEVSSVELPVLGTLSLLDEGVCNSQDIPEILPTGYWSSSKFGKMDVLYFFNSNQKYADLYLKTTVNKSTGSSLDFVIYTGNGKGGVLTKKEYKFRVK